MLCCSKKISNDLLSNKLVHISIVPEIVMGSKYFHAVERNEDSKKKGLVKMGGKCCRFPQWNNYHVFNIFLKCVYFVDLTQSFINQM